MCPPDDTYNLYYCSRTKTCTTGGGCCFDEIAGVRDAVHKNASTWLPCRTLRQPVQFCLSKQQQPRCTLYASSTLLIIVTAFNAVKTLCMIAVALRRRTEVLATVGDAIQSFMERPPERMPMKCLTSAKTAKKRAWWDTATSKPQIWREPAAKSTWASAVVRGKWSMFSIL